MVFLPVGWLRALGGEAQSCGMWRCVCEQGKVVRETALVMRLRRNGVVVLVPRFGIEGTVFMVEKTARGVCVCVCGEPGCGFVCVTRMLLLLVQVHRPKPSAQPRRCSSTMQWHRR